MNAVPGRRGSDAIRAPVAAGRFYPRDPETLREMVEGMLASVAPASGPVPKALIVPHAGYVFSGPIAASAYAQLRPARGVIRRVVLLGPSHFVALHGLGLSTAEAFSTPLGLVPLDSMAVRKVAAFPQVQTLDEAHQYEHSLEVQLPFLQVVLGEFTLVPLVVGEATPDEITPVLDALWGGPETCLVISSDLSHYLDPETAQRIDHVTARAIEELRPEAIGEDQACGRIPIRGLLRAAGAHGLHPATIDLRNSGDTAGPRDQVVGYGAFSFSEH